MNNPQAFLDIPTNWQRTIIPPGAGNQFQLQSSGGGGQGVSNSMMEHEHESPSMIRATSDSALHHSVLQKMNVDKQKNLLNIQNNQIKQRKPESVSLILNNIYNIYNVIYNQHIQWSDFDSCHYNREVKTNEFLTMR